MCPVEPSPWPVPDTQCCIGWTDRRMFVHTSEQMVASWVVGADAGALVSARLEEAEPGTGGKYEHPQLAWHSGPPGALPGPGFKSHPFPLWVAHSSPTGVSAQPATLYCLVPYLPHPSPVSLSTSCLCLYACHLLWPPAGKTCPCSEHPARWSPPTCHTPNTSSHQSVLFFSSDRSS